MMLKYKMKKVIDAFWTIIFWLVPVKKNKIIFDNFIGMGYGDNPKYVADEIIKRKYPIQIVWLVNNLDEQMPEQIKKVKINSVKAIYEKATSKVWVDNVRNAEQIKKRKNQIYLQLWHGPLGFKYLEKEAEQYLDAEYIERAKYDGRMIDAIIVSSSLQELQFKRAFWLNKSVDYLKYGLPRNDVLFNPQISRINEVRKKLNIQKNDYVILYAPTFRDDYSIDGYKIDFDSVLQAFASKVRKKCKIIIRLHPNVRNQKDIIKYNENILDGSGIADTQYISILSDCVISDYSSIVFDFIMLNKPVFICALDLNEYRQKRGLLKEFWTLPLAISRSNEQLNSNIVSFDQKEYERKIKDYLIKYPIFDKGNASEMTAKWIMNKMRTK